jgi:hypothetical protein
VRSVSPRNGASPTGCRELPIGAGFVRKDIRVGAWKAVVREFSGTKLVKNKDFSDRKRCF